MSRFGLVKPIFNDEPSHDPVKPITADMTTLFELFQSKTNVPMKRRKFRKVDSLYQAGAIVHPGSVATLLQDVEADDWENDGAKVVRFIVTNEFELKIAKEGSPGRSTLGHAQMLGSGGDRHCSG